MEQHDVWAERVAPRRARLVGGTALAAASMVIAGLGIAALPHAPARAAVSEEPLEVTLVERPELEPVAPEPTPAPEPSPAEPSPPEPTPAPPAPPPRAPRIEMPRAVPEDAPPETDVREAARSASEPAAEAATEGAESPGASHGRAGATAAPRPPAAPKPAPRPAGPIRVTNDVQPPRPIAMAGPAYPAAARASGVEGTVLVAYVVSETGAVSDARVVRGPPELAPACLAAVRAWRFSPAMAGGRPVAVQRTARFPFRLRT